MFSLFFQGIDVAFSRALAAEPGDSPSGATLALAATMRRILLSLAMTAFGCAASYDVTFKCDEPGTPMCPTRQECPTVPLGAGGCEDLPGLFGHEPTPVDVGRPVGCVVGLSYGNPYYGDSQQTCACVDFGTGAMWECPV